MTKTILVGTLLAVLALPGAFLVDHAKSDDTPVTVSSAISNDRASLYNEYIKTRIRFDASRSSDRQKQPPKVQVTEPRVKATVKPRPVVKKTQKPAEKRTAPRVQNGTQKPVTISGRPTGLWLELAKCESGASLTKNTGNGYYGAYQFSAQTWEGFTHGRFGPVLKADWTVQTFVAYRIWLKQGWGAYPGCGKKLGYPKMPEVRAP